MKFPYRKINLKHPFSTKPFILRPIIPISLRNNNESLRYEALIDSGADFNILPIEIADKLRMHLKTSHKISFTGIGGNTVNGFKADIVLEIGKEKVQTKTVFAPVGNGILGQYGFFDNFAVKFDLKNKEIEINSEE